MGGILDIIASKAGASDSSWVDVAVKAIQENAANIQQPEFRDAVIGATLVLVSHKDDVASLGVYGLTLFLQKLAMGDKTGAYITFIQTQSTFEDLISGENADAEAIILAKQKRDEMEAKAVSLAVALAEDGARVLLPFLLTLLL
jgi:hypothetical protein